jgi:hypothetical protein
MGIYMKKGMGIYMKKRRWEFTCKKGIYERTYKKQFSFNIVDIEIESIYVYVYV